jgi:putative flippase GtrA
MRRIWSLAIALAHSGARSAAIRYVFVGAAAALGYFVVCYLLQKIPGWTASLASGVAYGAMFGFAYLGQRNIAFRSTRLHRKSLPAYLLLQLGCALLAALIVEFLTRASRQSPLVASAAATVIAGGVSYVVSASWVFFDREPRCNEGASDLPHRTRNHTSSPLTANSRRS